MIYIKRKTKLNRGFTLVELLGVIIILSLLLLISLPSILNSVKRSSAKTDELTKELIYNATDLYMKNDRICLLYSDCRFDSRKFT